MSKFHVVPFAPRLGEEWSYGIKDTANGVISGYFGNPANAELVCKALNAYNPSRLAALETIAKSVLTEGQYNAL
jgi:hypothetical protein